MSKLSLMQRRGLVKRGIWKKTELVLAERQPKKTMAYRTVGAVGWAFQKMENIQRILKKQKRRVMFEPEFVRKLRVVNVEGGRLHVVPSPYIPYVRRVRAGEKMPRRWKESLAAKGKLHSIFPFLIGCGAGVLSIGGKYIIIPKRPATVGVHPGKYHWVAGMADYYRWAKGKAHELPHETASREVGEEIGKGSTISTFPTWFTAEKVAKEVGTAKDKLTFFGPGFKPLPIEKAPPLITMEDRNIHMFEVQYAVDIKTDDPDALVRQNFERVGNFPEIKRSALMRSKSQPEGGIYKFVGPAEDKWEMQNAAILPRNSKAIFLFLKSNKGWVTDASRLALLAYAAELRKMGK